MSEQRDNEAFRRDLQAIAGDFAKAFASIARAAEDVGAAQLAQIDREVKDALPRPAPDLSWVTTTCEICGHQEPLITGDPEGHWRSHSWWQRLFSRKITA
jgi:hypothetical protein